MQNYTKHLKFFSISLALVGMLVSYNWYIKIYGAENDQNNVSSNIISSADSDYYDRYNTNRSDIYNDYQKTYTSTPISSIDNTIPSHEYQENYQNNQIVGPVQQTNFFRATIITNGAQILQKEDHYSLAVGAIGPSGENIIIFLDEQLPSVVRSYGAFSNGQEINLRVETSKRYILVDPNAN